MFSKMSLCICRAFAPLTPKALISRRFGIRPWHIQKPSATAGPRLADRFNEHIFLKNSQHAPDFTDIKLEKLEFTPTMFSLLPFGQLLAMIQAATTLSDDIQLTSSYITALDMESHRRILNLSNRQLLDLVGTFQTILPDMFIRLDCYSPAMHRIVRTYESHQSVNDFVRICYYLGAAKKRGDSPQLLNEFIRRHYNKYLDKVDELDLAIVGTSAYRAAVPLKLNQSKRYEQEILQISDAAGLDWPLINAYIKVLRLSRIRSDAVKRRIMQWIESGRLDDASFVAIVHVFVFFADNRFVDGGAIKWFCRKAMDIVNKEMMRTKNNLHLLDVREKDVRVFLWCMAQLNVKDVLSVQEMEILVRIMLAKFRAGEFKNMDDVVDLTMTLWQLGYASKELFCGIFDAEYKEQTFDKTRFKLDTRKYLLLFCVEVEQPEWLVELEIPKSRNGFNENRPVRRKFLSKSEELNRVYEAIRREISDVSVDVVAPILNLNIPGILAKSKSDTQYIEVLERHTVLSDDESPFGMMQLKIRLLRQLGYRVDLINSIDKTDAELTNQIQKIFGVVNR